MSRTTKVACATTLGALAGGLVAAILTNDRNASGLGKTGQKLKDWVKTAAANPAMKSMAKGVAQQVESQLTQGASRKGHSMSRRRG